MLTANPAVIQGTPASRGLATGPARLILGSDDCNVMRQGDILVCNTIRTISPTQFARAAGIITETGAPLSNGATIAREYAIPIVTAVHGATMRIREGQVVTIDDATGICVLQG